MNNLKRRFIKALDNLDGASQGNTQYSQDGGVVTMTEGDPRNGIGGESSKANHGADTDYVDGDALEALAQSRRGSALTKGPLAIVPALSRGSGTYNEFSTILDDPSYFVSDNIDVNSTSNNSTTSKDTTILVDNNELYSIPHGNSGYYQITNNRVKAVRIPNNQQSIDSARASALQKLKEMQRQVDATLKALEDKQR